jgi:hypothetical protein
VAAGWFAVGVPGFDGPEQPVSTKIKEKSNDDTNFVEAFISSFSRVRRTRELEADYAASETTTGALHR